MNITEKATAEVQWLQDILIPIVLNNGKLVPRYDKGKDSFSVQNININFIGSDEAFMLTDCYKAKISYLYNGKSYTKVLLTKKTPNVPRDIYESVNFDALFRNEIYGYTKIIPEYLAIEEKMKSIIQSNGDKGQHVGCSSISSYSEYFYSDITNSNAVIVLGDFNLKGFRMTKSRVNLSLEHVLLAVKHIGKFHGIGFALKETNKTHFKELKDLFKESRFGSTLNEEYRIVMATSVERIIKAGKLHPQIPDEFLNNLRKLISDYWTYAKNIVQPIEPIATICHGDYLRNNVAYKYADELNPDKPTDILSFDWQTLRYSSPMIDLTTFLTVSAGRDVRPANFKSIFKIYRDALVSSYLATTNTDEKELPVFLSFKVLLREYIHWLPYGLCIAGSFLHSLFDPIDMSCENFLNNPLTPEESFEFGMNRGGESVDHELGAILLELYELTCQENIDLFAK